MNSTSVAKHISDQWKNKHLLTLQDFSQDELMALIEFGLQLKQAQKSGKPHPILAGKTLAMIFEKPSTRTRVSFETGMFQLGGHALFLGKNDIQMGNGETIADTAQVLSRYVDAIMIRTFEHEIVEELATHASIPIINGLTDDYHPCQVLADFMTIYEKKNRLTGLKLAYIGDGNNMANTLLMGCAIMGIDCVIASPSGYEVKAEVLEEAKQLANATGASLLQTNDPTVAVKDADIVYTDVWASMGFEDEHADRLKKFTNYQVNDELVKLAKDDYLFMHCLPAKRGEEVAASVIDGTNSVVFDEAENRLHIQKAILAAILG